MNEPHTADLPTRSRYRQEGAAYERERIEAIIIERITDLNTCHKNDDCQTRADSLLVVLCDIAEKLGGYCHLCKKEHS